MIAVIFLGRASPESQERYLELAAMLNDVVAKQPGFVSVERFSSLDHEGKILSLSFWENMEAVVAWKGHLGHRQAQAEGRTSIFSEYTIRVAQVLTTNDHSEHR